MKKLISMAAAGMLTLGTGSALAYPSFSGAETANKTVTPIICEVSSCTLQTTHTHSICSIVDCKLPVNHKHDGIIYFAHYENDGHDYHKVKSQNNTQTSTPQSDTLAPVFNCGIGGCSKTTEHSHSRCAVLGCNQMTTHEHNGTIYYGHSAKDGHVYHNCGVSGCTQASIHNHNSCGVSGCSNTGSHNHNYNHQTRRHNNNHQTGGHHENKGGHHD